MTTLIIDPGKARPGDLIGYRKDGRPIRLIAGGHTNPNTALIAYRGRDDSQTLNSATFTHALNTPWTQDTDTTFRVRFAFEENAGAPVVVGATVEASRNGGAFQAVTTTSSIVKAVISAQFADDAATTDLGLGGAGGFVAGRGSETGDPTDASLTSQHTEYEYALQIVGADVADADTIVIRVAGLNAYTSAGASITANKTAQTISLGLTTETESAPASGGSKIVALQMIRANIAWDGTPVTWDGSTTTWDFGEIETGQTAAPLKQIPLGQSAETETAQPVTLSTGGGQTIPLGLVTETETGQAVTIREDVTAGQPSETETAQSIGAQKIVVAGQPVETETAQPVGTGGPTVVPIGLVTETETSHAAAIIKTAAVSQPVESETVQQVTVRETVVLGQPSETETAQTVSVGGPIIITLGQVVETETAQQVTVSRAVALGQSTEAETGGSVLVLKRVTLAQLVELETAQAVGVLLLGLVTPADRTFTVPAETRTHVVPAESRTHVVAAESRTFVMTIDIRALVVT